MSEHESFNVGQKALIRKGNEVLVLTDPIEGLDYPGGRIEKGEMDLIEALKREVREETGLEITVGEPFTTRISTFPDGHPLVGTKIFLVAYRCTYVSGNVTLSHEHNRFRWVTKENFREADDGTTFIEILEQYFDSE